ncbi:MAG: Ig-like domain-containing protein, partial [Betaproteobacteria bacterium]|nr:Ig-like domain-containing protein [Betaproteobacteria bacterium]
LTVRAIADFEDETGVLIDEPGGNLRLEAADLAGMGYVGAQAVKIDAATGRVRFVAPGPALLVATWQDADGRALRAVAVLTAMTSHEGDWPPDIQPYPAALALPPGGARQLKVQGDDLNSGGFIDIHAARQTVFEGVPARIEDSEGPDGETVQIKYDAIPAVYSGTRYFSGDERIATVSADGLVTAHAPGKVTIDVVHLRSLSFDGNGTIERQIIGQRDVALTVTPAQVLDGAARPAVIVRPAEGGVVAAPTRETVMVGPDALAQDTAIGIRRIALADLASVTGLAAPAAGVLQALGAFHLDVGEQPSAAPLQLAVPVQGGIAARSGEEALFLRKGRVMVEGGGHRDTWWLVDSGIIGADGVARTTSLPGEGLNLPDGMNLRISATSGPLYGGVNWSGDYVVMRRAPGVAGRLMNVSIEPGAWLDFGKMNLSLAGGMTGALINSETLGALATTAADLRAGRHQFGVTQIAPVALPPETPDKGIALRVYDQLPRAPYPWGKVICPDFAKTPDAVSYDEVGNTVNFKLAMTDTGPFTGPVILGIRSLFGDGNYEIARFDGATLGDTLSITPPPDLMLGSTRWQLVCKIPVNQIDNSGELRATGKPLIFRSREARMELAPTLVAGLTCTGVLFMRENKVVSEVKLLDAQPGNDQGGKCLTASKAQPMALAYWSRLYVGGAGVVYVIGWVHLQLIDTIALPAGRNITSLEATGSLLLIGEGDSAGTGGFRLLAMFSDPQGGNYYHRPLSLNLPQLADSPLGVGDMVVGADGDTLVITVSKPQTGGAAKAGEVWVLDLNNLNLKTGDIDPPVVAQGDGVGELAAPLTITAAVSGNPDRYLVRSASGQQATLLLKRDAKRKVIEATLHGIDASETVRGVSASPLESATGASLPGRFTLTVPDDVKFAIVRKDTQRSISIRPCTCLKGQCLCQERQ